MIAREELEQQLKQTGSTSWFWNKSERRELQRILMEDEKIILCVDGRYSNGNALLCITDHRILLVDRKPLLYLTVEDIRYESVIELDLHHQLLLTHLQITAGAKSLRFSSAHSRQLRKVCQYVQNKMLEIRQNPNSYLKTQHQHDKMTRQTLVNANPYTRIDSHGIFNRLLPALMALQVIIISLMLVRFAWDVPSLSSNLLTMATALCAGALGAVSVAASSVNHDTQVRRKRHND